MCIRSVWHPFDMSTPDEAAAEHLSRTALRDFGPLVPTEGQDATFPTHVLRLMPDEVPLPVLLRHALALIGIPHQGPFEKVEWWVWFQYEGYPCSLAHQKFGLRLRISGDLTEEEAGVVLRRIKKKLITALPTVEALLAERAGDTLNSGNVTVVNQHWRLRRSYNYFRQRATNPDFVEDVHEHREGSDIVISTSHYVSGKSVMTSNAFHDLVAAISAYMSVLEHDLVLMLPFLDFDPSSDKLTEIIGDRWGEKWRRIMGRSDQEAARLRERLGEVVERWRNPYLHGGFEKGHGATVYLHTEGLGALPVAMSRIYDSPLFSFGAVSDMEIADVFGLFDEIDAYLGKKVPYAMEWIESGLNVRFDRLFIAEVFGCLDEYGDLQNLIGLHSYRVDMINNMDY